MSDAATSESRSDARRPLGGSRSRGRLGVPVALAAGVAILAFVSGAWGAFGGGGPQVSTFAIQLGSEPATLAKAYELDAALVSVDKKAPSPEYTLRISLGLTGSSDVAQAFVSGQTFSSVQVALLGADLAVLRTYELADATVVAYRQSGDAATNTFVQELVLRSRSLTTSTP